MKTKAKQELSVAEKFYIETHRGRLTVEKLSADVRGDAKVIQAFLDNLPPLPKQNKFEKQDGIVMMTGAQSATDDLSRSPATNSEFFEKHKSCIYKQDPNKPSQ